jgi:hypothetical protein
MIYYILLDFLLRYLTKLRAVYTFLKKKLHLTDFGEFMLRELNFKYGSVIQYPGYVIYDLHDDSHLEF